MTIILPVRPTFLRHNAQRFFFFAFESLSSLLLLFKASMLASLAFTSSLLFDTALTLSSSNCNQMTKKIRTDIITSNRSNRNSRCVTLIHHQFIRYTYVRELQSTFSSCVRRRAVHIRDYATESHSFYLSQTLRT